MKTWNRLFVTITIAGILTLGGLATRSVAEEPPPPPAPRLTLELSDGSRIQGVTALDTLRLHLPFTALDIPIDRIVSLEFLDDRETARIMLTGGDRLTGVPDLERIPLTTLFGEQAIGIEHVRRISVRTAAALPPELLRDLVLYYRFDEDEGDRVTDHSGRGNHGKVHGARFTTDGRVGGAMSFDGVSAYIDAGNAPALQLQSNFTIAAWIRPEPGDDSYAIVTKSHGYPNQSRRGVEFMLGNNNALGAYFWEPANQYMSGTLLRPLIQRHDWTHVVLQHDASRPRQMRFYVNGEEQEVSFSYETIGSIPVIRTVPEPLRVGCMRPGIHQFRGLVDDVMIFDRVLTRDEISALIESVEHGDRP